MQAKFFRSMIALVMVGLLFSLVGAPGVQAASRYMGINVALNTDITPQILSTLGKLGTVRNVIVEIDALSMKIPVANLAKIRALSFVAAANPDAARNGSPIDTVAADNFLDGINTWDQDAINVTDFGAGRVEPLTGEGVYVAVLDTGLVDTWRQYFPQERIASEFGIAFGGGGGEVGWVSSQPNKWEHDQDSHGTHVTSTILGYSMTGVPVNGVAPMVKIIPVKVLNQNGSGWSSVVARGIVYVTDLKISGALGDAAVVINMSLGGPVLDAVEKAAVDYAVANGVIIVASAGNSGTAGMGYPGAYAPVISVAASGWTGEWIGGRSWWYGKDVADPLNPEDYDITDFSSRAKPGQDLDVAAPGSWIVGPYNVNSGQISYYFLGGTSMASPHVAGIVALMVEKKPNLTAAEAEAILEAAAIPLAPGCRYVTESTGLAVYTCWEADATGAGLITADAALALTIP